MLPLATEFVTRFRTLSVMPASMEPQMPGHLGGGRRDKPGMTTESEGGRAYSPSSTAAIAAPTSSISAMPSIRVRMPRAS